MTPRKKVYLFLYPIFIAFFGGLYFFLAQDLTERLESIQKTEAISHALLIERLFEEQIHSLAVKSGDWSQWDDTYDFMQSRDVAYIESNLQDESFRTIDVNVIALYDLENRLAFGKEVSDSASDQGLLLFSDEFSKLTSLVLSEKRKKEGFFLTKDGKVFLVSAGPILPSDGSLEPRGVLFFGRYFDLEMEGRLAKTSGFRPSTLATTSGFFRSDLEKEEISRQLRGEGRRSAILYGSENVAGYTSLNDIFFDRRIAFRVESDPLFYQTDLENLYMFGRMMIGLPVLFLVFLTCFFEFFIFRKGVYLKE